MSRKVLASAAGDYTPAEVASDPNCELQNRRDHNDAFGLVEQILRNTVRDVHNFLEHLAARFRGAFVPGLHLLRKWDTLGTWRRQEHWFFS